MTKLIIASQNKHKIQEIRNKLQGIEVLGLSDDLFPEELIETGTTLQANAKQKVDQVYLKLKENCFADDTGLEVEALNGEPGVYSARYAGEQKDDEANIERLLFELKDKENRKARFRTVIALIWEGEYHEFEGICEGDIIDKKRGEKGFGYDPIFVPAGESRTFAEMSIEEKGKLSHRGKAMEKVMDFVNSQLSDLPS